MGYLRMIVNIDEVSAEKREIHVSSKQGRMVINYPINSTFFRVPKQGETWTIQRVDLTTWVLEGCVLDYEHTYSPGAWYVGTHEVGIQERQRFDITPSNNLALDLYYSPINLESLQLFNNGRLIDPATINVEGTRLTINSPGLETGWAVVYYTRSAA